MEERPKRVLKPYLQKLGAVHAFGLCLSIERYQLFAPERAFLCPFTFYKYANSCIYTKYGGKRMKKKTAKQKKRRSICFI